MEANSELKYIFSNINDWLKFAEAKHGGLIALNSGLVFALLSKDNDIQLIIDHIIVIAGVFVFILSIGFSIASQFPRTKNIFKNNKAIPLPNLYFFGDLSYLDNESFINAFKKIDENFTTNKLDDALLNQILVNARIVTTKFKIFKFASYLTAFGIALISLGFLIKITFYC